MLGNWGSCPNSSLFKKMTLHLQSLPLPSLSYKNDQRFILAPIHPCLCQSPFSSSSKWPEWSFENLNHAVSLPSLYISSEFSCHWGWILNSHPPAVWWDPGSTSSVLISGHISHSPSCCHISSAVHGRPAHRSSTGVCPWGPTAWPLPPSLTHCVPITVEPIILSFFSFTTFIALITFRNYLVPPCNCIVFTLSPPARWKLPPKPGFLFLFFSCSLLSIQVLKQCLEMIEPPKISMARTIL